MIESNHDDALAVKQVVLTGALDASLLRCLSDVKSRKTNIPKSPPAKYAKTTQKKYFLHKVPLIEKAERPVTLKYNKHLQ